MRALPSEARELAAEISAANQHVETVMKPIARKLRKIGKMVEKAAQNNPEMLLAHEIMQAMDESSELYKKQRGWHRGLTMLECRVEAVNGVNTGDEEITVIAASQR